MMKRVVTLIICILLISNTLAFPAAASEFNNQDSQIVISQKVEFVGDDCYYIETISIPSVQIYSNTKTGTKTAAYVASGTTIFSVSVTGKFTYDGSTSDATSSTCAVATYVEGATINSRNAYTSGASAVASGSVTYIGITLQKTVTLTCDKNGNLS